MIWMPFSAYGMKACEQECRSPHYTIHHNRSQKIRVRVKENLKLSHINIDTCREYITDLAKEKKADHILISNSDYYILECKSANLGSRNDLVEQFTHTAKRIKDENPSATIRTCYCYHSGIPNIATSRPKIISDIRNILKANMEFKKYSEELIL
jgi:hypothetical protein